MTIKQKKFVREIIKTGNGTQAALSAYNVKKIHTAESIASENLRKPEIRAAIDAEFRKEDLTVSWVLKGLKMHAEASDEAKDRIKSFELIGKYLKMFVDVQETKDTTNDIPTDPEGRKQELNRLLDRLNALRSSEGSR